MTDSPLTAVALVCSLTAQGSTFWNGEAMQSMDYNDLDGGPQAA